MNGTRTTTKAPETVPFVCPPHHKHGATSTCYSDHKCRCADCREWRHRTHRAYLAKRGRDEVQQYVPAAGVAAHIAWLVNERWTYHDVAHVSGVSVPTINRIMQGRVKKVEQETADAILGTRPEMRYRLGAPRLVPAIGVQRRIQALRTLGWTVAEIARRAGKTSKSVVLYLDQESVTYEAHQAIARVYDQMWDKTPPRDTPEQNRLYLRSKRHAERQGWAGPLAWDDDTIDDPDAKPNTAGDGSDEPIVDEIAVHRALAGEKVRLGQAERREIVKRAHERRWSDVYIARRTGMSEKTVLRIREELRLPAIPLDEQTERATAA